MKTMHKIYIKGKWFYIDLDNRILIRVDNSSITKEIKDEYAIEHFKSIVKSINYST